MDKKRRQGASAPTKYMNSEVAFLVTPQNVTISRDGKTLMVNKQYSDFNGIIEKLKAKSFDEAFELADRALSLAKGSKGVFTVKGGVVYRDGVPVHNVISDRIMQFQEQGMPFEPLVVFLENLMKNPSERSIKELYKFLENQYLPVTQDGCFLAYKGVDTDFRSVTSGSEDVEVSEDGGKTWNTFKGKIPNKVGSVVRMSRELVDDNANQTCSVGLHAGDMSYATNFGRRTVVIKINPRDAVSVPVDENGKKLRVCQYEVIAEFNAPFKEAVAKVTPSFVATENSVVPSLSKDMTLTLVGKKNFDKKDIRKAVDTIKATAKKFLKLRNPKVTATGEVNGKDMVIQVHMPLDSRYKQKETEFTVAWQEGIQKKLNPKSALLK